MVLVDKAHCHEAAVYAIGCQEMGFGSVWNADKVARNESLAMFRMQTTATLSVGLHQDGHGSSGASHILSH